MDNIVIGIRVRGSFGELKLLTSDLLFGTCFISWFSSSSLRCCFVHKNLVCGCKLLIAGTHHSKLVWKPFCRIFNPSPAVQIQAQFVCDEFKFLPSRFFLPRQVLFVHHEVYPSLSLVSLFTIAAPLPVKRVERVSAPFSGPLTGLLGGCDIHDGHAEKTQVPSWPCQGLLWWHNDLENHTGNEREMTATSGSSHCGRHFWDAGCYQGSRCRRWRSVLSYIFTMEITYVLTCLSSYYRHAVNARLRWWSSPPKHTPISTLSFATPNIPRNLKAIGALTGAILLTKLTWLSVEQWGVLRLFSNLITSCIASRQLSYLHSDRRWWLSECTPPCPPCNYIYILLIFPSSGLTRVLSLGPRTMERSWP